MNATLEEMAFIEAILDAYDNFEASYMAFSDLFNKCVTVSKRGSYTQVPLDKTTLYELMKRRGLKKVVAKFERTGNADLSSDVRIWHDKVKNQIDNYKIKTIVIWTVDDDGKFVATMYCPEKDVFKLRLIV